MSRNVLVVGLRATGAAVVRAGAREGDTVTVVEEDPGHRGYDEHVREAHELGATVVEQPAADDWVELLTGVDLMVPSPGVRPGHPAFRGRSSRGSRARGR